MILVFDLDDTLYSEITYVQSGLKAVSHFLNGRYGISTDDIYSELIDVLKRDGRGKIFDSCLTTFELFNASVVKECLSVYRSHTPAIQLFQETLPTLEQLDNYPHYLVTDGNKVVQQRKVSALGIHGVFRKVFITHRYGLKHAKPSTYCFEKIRCVERVSWSKIIYVGDNPNKDFVNLNKVGARTVRVRTGSFGATMAKPGFDAQHSIDHIRHLPALLEKQYGLALR